jgi:type IV pilus assembly protein PilO
MLEKFKSLAWYIQLTVLVVIAGAIWYFGVYWFFTSETRAETQILSDQVAQLTAKNNAAKIATQRIGEFRTIYAAKEEEYAELKVLLPEEREITNVLQGLQDTARESRLVVNLFKPQDETQQGTLMAKQVLVEVDSNFNNLRVFFDRMAKLQRIVSISDFNIKQLEKQSANRTLNAQFTLTAYYAAPDDLVVPVVDPNAKPGAPGAPGAPGTPGAVPQNGAVAPPPPTNLQPAPAKQNL